MVDIAMNKHAEHANIPSGTITFLFTDIEGSTKLLERLRGEYATLLAEHYEIMRMAFAKWNGYEVDTQGDSFFVTFPRASDAVSCVMEAQRALAAHPWLQGVAVRVRMGLHTGEAIVMRTSYVGMDVHLAARIASAGHGGQVLLSQTTHDLIYQDLPPGASLHDLGAHKLKDIRYSQQIYQLDIEGLRCEFPPLRTLSAVEEPPTLGEPPFKGLQYFDEADADLFFGREQLTSKLAGYVRQHRFLAVIGASGSGKSSIVRAGLIPALRRNQWHIHIITPTAHPLEALARTLTRTTESISATTTLMDDLGRDARTMHLYVRKTATDAGRVLIIVDQFEELYTLCRNESERRAFVDNLLYAAETDDGTITLVLVLRADFYSHLAQYDSLREQVAKHQEYIGPMTTAELRQAIEEPAQRGGWEFTPGLVDLMLHDVGADKGRQPEPGALPLLSHALLETWNRRRGNVMILKSYSESGEVRGAIAHTAERVYNQEFTAEQQAIARNIFIRLTELGEGTQDTRRRASFDELIPPAPLGNATQVEDVLVKLADARLITTGESTVEIAHEALIREWPTLREWLNQNRDGLRLHRHLTESAQAWQSLNHEPGELYRGARLAQAIEWTKTNTVELNPLEREFLDASKELVEREEAEREAQRQRELQAAQKLAATEKRAASRLRQRAMFLAGALLIAAVLALAATVFAQQSNENAERAENEQRIAFARELAATSVSNLEVDPERSILLALQAVSIGRSFGGSVLREAEEALHHAVVSSRLRLTLRGHTSSVSGLSFSPDGTRLATFSYDGSAKVWDTQSGRVLLTLPTKFASTDWDQVKEIAFSPDGKFVATATPQNGVAFWDASTGQLLSPSFCCVDKITSIAFNRDGTRLAMTGLGRTVMVWDTSTRNVFRSIKNYGNVVAFSPDGTRLVTDGCEVSYNCGAIVWELSTGTKLLTLAMSATQLFAVQYSPDGKQIATAKFDATTAQVWDANSGQLLHTLFGHFGVVNAIAFSWEWTRIATAGSDGTARIWETATGRELLVLRGHDGYVLDVAFSPDGKSLATASTDATVRIWDISSEGSREWLTFAGHTGSLLSDVAFSPDGTRIASINGSAGNLQVWNASTGEVLLRLPQGNSVRDQGIAYSPDGKRLAFADGSNNPQILDATTGKQLLNLQTPVLSRFAPSIIAYSPNGKLIGMSNLNGEFFVCDATSGELVHTETAGGNALAFSPDGKHLALEYKNQVRILNTQTWTPGVSLSGYPGVLKTIAYSADGTRTITAGSDGTARVWDSTTGKEFFTLYSHTSGVNSAAFSPDGKYVAVTVARGVIKLWDVSQIGKADAQPISLYGHTASVWVLAFSPDGKRLATAGQDGTVRIYALDLDDLVAIAKSRVTRALTTNECQEYLHVAKCP